MGVRQGDEKNCSDKERKGLKIVSERSFSPASNAGERSNLLLPRTGSPTVAPLPALEVRHDDDVHNAEDHACGEQGEFDSHKGKCTRSHGGEPTFVGDHGQSDFWQGLLLWCYDPYTECSDGNLHDLGSRSPGIENWP